YKSNTQGARMADWRDPNLPHNCRNTVSPATRAGQTAEALGRKFKIVADLAPDSTAERILAAAHWPDSREPVLIIGHQPTLGQVAATLLTGAPQDWTIRKGNIWWIVQREREGVSEHFIRSVMGPDLAK